MKKLQSLLFLIVLCSGCAAQNMTVSDAFLPDQGSTALVTKVIGEARKSIRVAAYSFTSKPISEALVEAESRGIDVKVVLDRSQRTGRGSLYQFLLQNNVPTRINSQYHIMHDKFMLIDGEILETGSFNYTKSAEINNAENVLVIRNNDRINGDYSRQWEKLWEEGQY